MSKPAMQLNHWIGGQSIEPGARTYFDDRNPLDDSLYAVVARGTAADVDRAVKTAHAAFAGYRKTLPKDREAWLQRAASAMEAREREFLDILIDEIGSPLQKAKFEFGKAVSMMRAAAGMARQVKGHTMPSDSPGRISLSVRQPIGVVAAITPFNVPLIKGVRLSANPLALGNTVVLLPSEQAPASATLLAEVYREAGIPDGAMNVVTGIGEEIGDTLTTHPHVAMVTFTGSSRVGKHIAVLCARHGKRVTLELGGKNPVVVLADADLDRTIPAVVHGIFTYQGQVCMGASRIYVERPVFDDFIARFKRTAEALGMGDLRDPRTVIGPIISERQRARVRSHIEDAVAKGAALVTGGTWENNRCRPTILAGVNDSMTVCRDETFGPVTAVHAVENAEEALARANDSTYGLSAAVFTRSIDKALPLAQGIAAGMVHVNSSPLQDEPHVPFGGVGDSGVGREGTEADIEAMTEWKWITIQT